MIDLTEDQKMLPDFAEMVNQHHLPTLEEPGFRGDVWVDCAMDYRFVKPVVTSLVLEAGLTPYFKLRERG